MRPALLIIYAYLLGSIPFGLIIAKTKGIDLRQVGSGNIGATNVLRAVGKKAALFTLLCDILKGAVPVAVGRMLGVGPLWEGAIGLSAVAGHVFSLFLKFKGGKGVATALGVILIYVPKAGILTIAVWLVTAVITRYSSVGAVVCFSLLPPGVLVLGYSIRHAAASLAIALLVVFRHIENIKRIAKGAERRIGEKA